MRRSIASVAIVSAIVAAGCGSTIETSSSDRVSTTPTTGSPQTFAPATDVESDAAAEQTDDQASEAAATSITFPDVQVHDVRTGDFVNLTSFAPSDRPILLWFWAPH